MAGNAYNLTVRRGPDEGQSIPLEEDSVILGRDPTADVVISDPEVSRQHARFTRSDEGYEIQDLGSTNGTFIDGKRLEGDPVQLGPGAVITIGNNVTLVYQRSEEDPMATVISSEGGPDFPWEESEADEEEAEPAAAPEVSEEPEIDPWEEPAVSENEATFMELPAAEEAAAPSPEEEELPTFDEDDFEEGEASDARTILDMEAQGSAFAAQEQAGDEETGERASFSQEEPELPSFEEEEAYSPPPPPQPAAGEQGPPPPPSVAPSDDDDKSNRNLIIAAVVILILLCCCCLLLYAGWIYGDQILFELQQM